MVDSERSRLDCRKLGAATHFKSSKHGLCDIRVGLAQDQVTDRVYESAGVGLFGVPLISVQ